MWILTAIEWSNLHLSTPVALAAVATIGYFVGRSKREKQSASSEAQARRELKRAQAVAKELEQIADVVRRSLATHHSSVLKFKDRMSSMGSVAKEGAWQDLCAEAEEMLKPTLQLAAQMAAAYDQIRQQSNNLMTFTEVRTDALTGVSNRRALDDTLESLLAMLHRYEQAFSILIVDIDNFKKLNDEQGHLYGDRMLKAVAKLLADTVRETDMVARYGGEEFVIVMPQTPLDGAIIFAERLRQRIEQDLPLTVSGGVTATAEGDDSQTLLARADAALYSAKAAGRNRLFCHTGQSIEPAMVDEDAVPPIPSTNAANGQSLVAKANS